MIPVIGSSFHTGGRGPCLDEATTSASVELAARGVKIPPSPKGAGRARLTVLHGQDYNGIRANNRASTILAEYTMRYLLLCCTNEHDWNGLPATERDEIMKEYRNWMQDLDRAGGHIASAQLQPTATAATVRMKGGKHLFTDGPFAETKEQLGGYHLIECADMGKAKAIAARIPTLRVGGTVEVRPLL